MNDSKPIIETNRLTKIYGKNVGLWGLDLKVQTGEIFGFLGPNGSGKTTTINLLLDLIRPTRGEARVFDLDTHKKGRQIRANVGYIPGEPGFYEEMTGWNYLNFFAGLKGVNCKNRIMELADIFFQVKLKRKIKAYSRGMKQLICIIQAFMGDPDLYILDEPTSNLDPLMNQRFYRLLEEEKKRGKTIFLSSHMLGEVERVCDRVGIIRRGEMALVESVDRLREKMKRTIEVKFKEEVDPENLKVEGVKSVTKQDHRFILEITGELNPVLAKISQYPIKTFDYHKMTLEEIFWDYFEKNNDMNGNNVN